MRVLVYVCAGGDECVGVVKSYEGSLGWDFKQVFCFIVTEGL